MVAVPVVVVCYKTMFLYLIYKNPQTKNGHDVTPGPGTTIIWSYSESSQSYSEYSQSYPKPLRVTPTYTAKSWSTKIVLVWRVQQNLDPQSLSGFPNHLDVPQRVPAVDAELRHLEQDRGLRCFFIG